MTAAGLRRVSGIAGIAGMLLLVQAIVLWIIIAETPARLLLPVTLGPLGGRERIVLFTVDLGAGVIALCLLVAVSRLIVVVPGVFPRYSSGVRSNRHTARWIEFAFSSSITIFLVAQLNGISDIGALVLSYATTSGMTLFSVLQERSPRSTSWRMLPLSFAAATGIVPWGVIAFHQVAALALGQPPSAFALAGAATKRFSPVSGGRRTHPYPAQPREHIGFRVACGARHSRGGKCPPLRTPLKIALTPFAVEVSSWSSQLSAGTSWESAFSLCSRSARHPSHSPDSAWTA
jgi:hypothetical protein